MNALSADLDGAWEVLAEAVQTVMRASPAAPSPTNVSRH